MLTASDSTFKDTLEVKQNRKNLSDEFLILKEWLQKHYKVDVLNICYSFIFPSGNKIPRLDIIFENNESLDVFKDSDGRFSEAIMNKVITEFERVCKDLNLDYVLEDIMVIFSSFKPIAMSLVNKKLNEYELDLLIENVNRPSLWKIQNYFGSTTVFLFTDEQVNEHRDSIWIKELKDKYFELIKKYDEFDYFSYSNFNISIDSKQNFDDNYSSSWFMYYE